MAKERRSAQPGSALGATDTVGRCRQGSRLHREDKRHTRGYAAQVKTYAWSTEKNDFLQRERGVSFEDVVLNIQLGNEIDVLNIRTRSVIPGRRSLSYSSRGTPIWFLSWRPKTRSS